jgi:hypothetical protein
VYYLNAIGLAGFFYWKYWWYDIMMHFLTGALIAGCIMWAVLRFRPNIPRRDLLLITVVGTIFVGIGWEIMEYVGGITRREPGYVFDTIKDLILDTAGSITVWLAFRSIFSFKQNAPETPLS